MIENYSCNLLPQITWIDRIFSNNGLKRITQIAQIKDNYKQYKSKRNIVKKRKEKREKRFFA